MHEGDVLAEFFRRVDYSLSRVYFGNIVNALLTGTIGAITYNLLNLVAPPDVPVPLPSLAGVLTGLGSLVPVIGIKIVWVPVALLLLADSLVTDPSTAWFPVLFGLVSVVVVDSIPDFFLRPFVSGRGLHVGAVMLAYVFGPLLFGWYGIFLGPLILVVLVAFARVIVPWVIDPDRPVEPLDPTESGPEPPIEREPVEGSDDAPGPERTESDGEEPPATESDSGDVTSSRATPEG